MHQSGRDPHLIAMETGLRMQLSDSVLANHCICLIPVTHTPPHPHTGQVWERRERWSKAAYFLWGNLFTHVFLES